MATAKAQLTGEGRGSGLDIRVVTPRGVITHQEADGLTAPGELGEFELLHGHVPMLTALKPGVLTIGEKRPVRYAVSSGYLRVDVSGAVEVLVEQAMLGSDVDPNAARNDQATAEAEIAKWGDKELDGDYKNLVQRAAWAKARLDAASS